ncbi:hypothetical protein RSOLAG1IB_11688 [Rhizoctonia solani AG-1 IB]|uniref:Uncharacterized protein n=1 Tax=Thanatephorus cucumeris (strain AG1-IB / isolate 7/3/14) TaxID=1108050 RepID=A0A0B7FAR7_THACB|nr:hypothetical protein RSOLAG1IB_11688 [Rhizoctonia solani AG-1 IB]
MYSRASSKAKRVLRNSFAAQKSENGVRCSSSCVNGPRAMRSRVSLANSESGCGLRPRWPKRRSARRRESASRRERSSTSSFEFGKKPERKSKAGESQGENYGVRAKVVQGFVEKATAFSATVGFVDPNLSSATSEDKAYPLAPLFDQFLEYAQILSAQGLVPEAVRYVERLPTGCVDVQWLKGAYEKKVNGTTSASKGDYSSPASTGTYGAPAGGAYGAAPS